MQQLLTHVLAAPQRFLQMARGEEVDWESTPGAAGDRVGPRRSARTPTT